MVQFGGATSNYQALHGTVISGDDDVFLALVALHQSFRDRPF